MCNFRLCITFSPIVLLHLTEYLQYVTYCWLYNWCIWLTISIKTETLCNFYWKNTVCILTNPYFCTNLHVCSKTNRNTNQMIPLKICMCWAIQKGNDSVIRICNHKKRSKQFNWHKHWWWCSVLPMLVYSSGNGLSEFLKNKKNSTNDHILSHWIKLVSFFSYDYTKVICIFWLY